MQSQLNRLRRFGPFRKIGVKAPLLADDPWTIRASWPKVKYDHAHCIKTKKRCLTLLR